MWHDVAAYTVYMWSGEYIYWTTTFKVMIYIIGVQLNLFVYCTWMYVKTYQVIGEAPVPVLKLTLYLSTSMAIKVVQNP
jgi:hypothetical protein